MIGSVAYGRSDNFRFTCIFIPSKEVMFSSLSVCLSVCLLANFSQNLRTDLHQIFREGWQWGNEQVLNFGGDLDHHLDAGIVFRIRHYWQIRKVVSTVCAARRCSARHALAGIAIATMTSLVTGP